MLLLGKLQPAPGIDVTWLHYWSALPDGLYDFIYNLRTRICTSQRIFGRTRIPHLNKEIC